MSRLITKADGSQELFDPIKLSASLTKIGASEEMRAKILDEIHADFDSLKTTEAIYAKSYELLKNASPATAARYSIKRAVLALGPSGFPFEKFIAEVLRAHGATMVQTDVTLNGACVPHEVDVYATINGTRVAIEAKFHNSLGTKTDIKDMLYVHSRFNDLVAAKPKKVDIGWLVTNTRFTTHAEQYALCAGVTAIGWDYPKGKDIQNLIESAGVHPVTCLTLLSHAEKQTVLSHGVVLAKEIRDRPEILKKLGIHGERAQAILEEASHVSVTRPHLNHALHILKKK